MQSINSNSGVTIGGNSTGPVAAGQNPTAVQNVYNSGNVQLSLVLDQLQQTRSWIEEHRSEVPAADLAIVEVDRLANLLQATEPDRKSIKASVERLATWLGAAGGIAGGIQGLQELIGQFLG